MKIEDIKVGELYQLTFSPSVGKVKIFSDPLLSPGFLEKYQDTMWGEYSGFVVRIIEHTKNTSGLSVGIKFRFESDPPSCYATILSNYFKEIEHCNCNLWVTGCKCGIFQKESQVTIIEKKWRYL